MTKAALVPITHIERVILVIRGHKVILDADLAALYGVETKTLNRAMVRNKERFPSDFVFRLTAEEVDSLRYQFGTSKLGGHGALRSLFGTSKGRGGRRYPPYAFTEEGVAMLSSVLRSARAVQVNIAIMRAFVRIRQFLATDPNVAAKLSDLERKYAAHDKEILALFDAIRDLVTPRAKPKKRIGFGTDGA